MLKILFAGIDGSGKTTCIESLVDRLNARHRILRIGNYDPYVYFQGRREPALGRPQYAAIQALRRKADRWHLLPLFMVFNFVYKQVLSLHLSTSDKADLVVFGQDTLLHPAAYSSYHLPWTKRIPRSWKLRILRAVFGPRGAFLTFYLDVTTETAMERIESRGKTPDPHENPEDLTVLRAELGRMVDVAERGGVDIVRIDANAKTPEEITVELEAAVLDRLAPAPSEPSQGLARG